MTAEILKALKMEYSPYKIIYITLNDKEFVFRSLNRKELQDIYNLGFDEHSANELICQTSVIIPNSEDYDFSECGLAGLPDFVSEIIVNESSLFSAEEVLNLLEEKRSQMNAIEKQAFVFIKIAFPEVTKEQYEEMTWDEVCEYVALAEEIINTKETISIDKLLDRNSDVRLDIAIPKEEKVKPKSERQQLEEHRKYIFDLYKKGIDPMFIYGEPKLETRDVVDKPFLMSRLWNNEVVMNEIRKTISKTSKQVR